MNMKSSKRCLTTWTCNNIVHGVHLLFWCSCRFRVLILHCPFHFHVMIVRWTCKWTWTDESILNTSRRSVYGCPNLSKDPRLLKGKFHDIVVALYLLYKNCITPVFWWVFHQWGSVPAHGWSWKIIFEWMMTGVPPLQETSMWLFPEIGIPPVIIHLSRIFFYKPSILGVPPFQEPPTSWFRMTRSWNRSVSWRSSWTWLLGDHQKLEDLEG